MDNKKDNTYYVKKIVADLAFILEHTNGLTQQELEGNEIMVDSVMFRLLQKRSDETFYKIRTYRPLFRLW